MKIKGNPSMGGLASFHQVRTYIWKLLVKYAQQLYHLTQHYTQPYATHSPMRNKHANLKQLPRDKPF